MKSRIKIVPTLALLMTLSLFSALYADSTGKTLDMTFAVRNGTGDEPMIAVWLESDTGDFIQTLHVFSKKKEYYKDLLGWLFKSKAKEKPADVDAVSGATIRWNQSSTISIPAQVGSRDLLSGSYVLRIESRKDKGNHYRGFKIPLPAGYAGGVHVDEGYVKSVEIKIKDKAE